MIKVNSITDMTEEGPMANVVLNTNVLKTLETMCGILRRETRPFLPEVSGAEGKGIASTTNALDLSIPSFGERSVRSRRRPQLIIASRPITTARKIHSCFTYSACCSALCLYSASKAAEEEPLEAREKDIAPGERNLEQNFNTMQGRITMLYMLLSHA